MKIYLALRLCSGSSDGIQIMDASLNEAHALDIARRYENGIVKSIDSHDILSRSEVFDIASDLAQILGYGLGS